MGCYNGIRYVQRRLCDMFSQHRSAALWYFLLDDDGHLTGDHFRTLREMQAWIDHKLTPR